MLRAYDKEVKKLIQIFAPKIKVIGLQNEDSTDSSESVMTQAGKSSKEDKVKFPLISVFRNPAIELIDGSATKRPSTSSGYQVRVGDSVLSLVTMRADLTYTVDVFDVTRASAEELAIKLFFRLRNNPDLKTTFNFKDFNQKITCTPTIELNETIENQRINSLEKAQCYKIRFSFKLANVNIYEILDKDIPDLSYFISVRSYKNSNSI